MSLVTTWNFNTEGNYNYDSDKVEFVGGKAQLKDLTPANATFYAAYGSDINGNWGGGVLTGSGVGSPTVSGGKLDLKGGGVKYVDYDADLNADSQQVGCIRMRIAPNYTGAPAANRAICVITRADAQDENQIFIDHQVTGNLRLRVWDGSGIQQIVWTAAWSPTSGQTYEIELNWDFTTGATRIFIDGVQLGTTIATTMTRSSDTVTCLGNSSITTAA